MNKRFFITIILSMIALNTFSFTSLDGKPTTAFKMRYTKYGSGWASAQYEGTNRTSGVYTRYLEDRNRWERDPNTTIDDCEKTTKLEFALMMDALDEFDYREGEIYSFDVCTGDLIVSAYLKAWGEIKKDKYGYIVHYYAYYYQ